VFAAAAVFSFSVLAVSLLVAATFAAARDCSPNAPASPLNSAAAVEFCSAFATASFPAASVAFVELERNQTLKKLTQTEKQREAKEI